MRDAGRKGGAMNPLWMGPYRILDIDSQQTMQLMKEGGTDPLKVRVAYCQLKPVRGRDSIHSQPLEIPVPSDEPAGTASTQRVKDSSRHKRSLQSTHEAVQTTFNCKLQDSIHQQHQLHIWSHQSQDMAHPLQRTCLLLWTCLLLLHLQQPHQSSIFPLPVQQHFLSRQLPASTVLSTI
ncbi:uncharacterized protein [Littorina saxatilis]|uniref:uncharacterized protein n=1 Tax=Littorina saxatilis TaxID=31220 RepID=UPI0038B4EEFC